jgi:alkylation response protein AidB-like acyl-CoA dehydrogenase
LLFHERTAVGGGSPYASGYRPWSQGDASGLIDDARRTGQLADVRVREDIGEARAMTLVRDQLIHRISVGVRTGALPPAASSVIRLFRGEAENLLSDTALRVAGAAAATGDGPTHPGVGAAGQEYLSRQASSLAGGTSEISRNVISERLLGMPREPAADQGIPFNQIRQGH